MRIYIIGMPGTGKTYFGRILAKSLSMGFIDLDQRIEVFAGLPARTIIQEKGEPQFRTMEKNMLREVSAAGNTVIACGGGTPVFFDNMDFMKAHGLVIWLNTDLDIIASRIAQNITRRPLFLGMDKAEIRVKLDEIYDLRRRYYMRADVQCDVKNLQSPSLSPVIQRIIKMVQRKNRKDVN